MLTLLIMAGDFKGARVLGILPAWLFFTVIIFCLECFAYALLLKEVLDV